MRLISWTLRSGSEHQPLIQLISSRSVSAWVKEGLLRHPLKASRTARMSPHREGGGLTCNVHESLR
jgi:hypothetical protein